MIKINPSKNFFKKYDIDETNLDCIGNDALKKKIIDSFRLNYITKDPKKNKSLKKLILPTLKKNSYCNYKETIKNDDYIHLAYASWCMFATYKRDISKLYLILNAAVKRNCNDKLLPKEIIEKILFYSGYLDRTLNLKGQKDVVSYTYKNKKSYFVVIDKSFYRNYLYVKSYEYTKEDLNEIYKALWLLFFVTIFL